MTIAIIVVLVLVAVFLVGRFLWVPSRYKKVLSLWRADPSGIRSLRALRPRLPRPLRIPMRLEVRPASGRAPSLLPAPSAPA